MKTLKKLIFVVLALSMVTSCMDFVTPRQEPDHSHERDLLKSKLTGEWVLSSEKGSYIYAFTDGDTIYTKTREGDMIDLWPYQTITGDSIRIVRNDRTTRNRVVFYSNDSIRIEDFIPSDAAVYPPMFGDVVLKRLSQNEDSAKEETLCNCVMDTLQGKWTWVKTYGGFHGTLSDNEFKSVLKITGQNEDRTINYESYVADTLFYKGTFKFEQTQWTNIVIQLPHWIADKNDRWNLLFRNEQDKATNDTVCFYSGNPDDYMFYYKKIK
ncbi:MAG: hypothetical protein LBM08_14835 [Dysgonamonadaceae bacterium]|jgi:hypothetical protein|nr:hypothetical protein [Dysgonamonadaceae bacterium]